MSQTDNSHIFSHVLTTADVRAKIKMVDDDLHVLLSHNFVPLMSPAQDKHPLAKHAQAFVPARDTKILDAREMPPRAPLHTSEGLARLLHDLASIELQAVELGLKTLIDFTEAPTTFREELADITRQETTHLELCLREIENLGFKWGDWPVHIGLWQGALGTDNLLDRILMVHRHMEGSGLDAGESFLRKLANAPQKTVVEAVRKIVREEVAHVDFGSRWYREICRMQNLDADVYFKEKMSEFIRTVPRREKIARTSRLAAGFDLNEIEFLEQMRASLI